MLLSLGTGSSNASNILTERLKKHDLGIYAKIISQAEVNTSAMTEAQVLTYGRQALVTHTHSGRLDYGWTAETESVGATQWPLVHAQAVKSLPPSRGATALHRSQVPGPRRNALHRWTVIPRSVHEQPFRGIVTTPMADGERL